MMAAFTVSFTSCSKDDDKDDRNILDYSAQELAEAAKVKMNDWTDLELKGSVKEYTEIEYYDAEMNTTSGSLIKNNPTGKSVYTFNTAGFITSTAEYEAIYDFDTDSYSANMQLQSERQGTLNEQNQIVEVLAKEYDYNYDPFKITYTKYTYTYTATEATVERYSSQDAGQTWKLEGQTVYLLDEYGRIDTDNTKTYTEVANAPVLKYETVTDRKKDNVGNIISDLMYHKYYDPEEEYYLNYYAEYTYEYYN